jgi:hypothetical protein
LFARQCHLGCAGAIYMFETVALYMQLLCSGHLEISTRVDR